MKNKNQKIMFACMGVVVLIAVIYFIWQSSPNEPSVPTPTPESTIATLAPEGNQEKPEVSQEDGLDVDLVEYKVYDVAEIDFKFVIARVRVQSDEAIHLTLDNFITSEEVSLGNVDEYVKSLEEQGLFLGKENVWFEIISQDSQIISNIFIPVIDKSATELTLDSGTGDEVMEFDLTNPSDDAQSLRYVADDVISDGKTYQMSVSEAFSITGEEITRTYSNGISEPYLSSSGSQMHAFKVEAVSLWGDDVVIEEATYVVSDTGENFIAFNEQFTTEKYENLIGLTITDKENGILFFETLNPSQSPLTYQGELRLKIKGQDSEIVIQVDL